MKTQYYAAASLDGFVADEDHSLEWLFQFENPDTYPDFIRDVGAIAMGSATYEWILRYQQSASPDELVPWPYEQPTWVFSSRNLPSIDDADARFVRGDVGPVHRDMKQAAGGKNIWICGGGDLVGQFYDAGLLDELIVQVTSVTLGKGAPLLPRRITHPPLHLSSVRQFGHGFVELRYDVSYAEGREGAT